MTITQARARLSRAIDDGLSYDDDELDDALQAAGNWFCRETRCLRTVSDVTVADGVDALVITTPVAAGFTPERLISVHLPSQEERLSVVDYESLNALREADRHSGKPQFVAFTSGTTAEVYPTPSAAATGKLVWWQAFTSWTPGDEAAGDTTLNLPDELLIPTIQFGAAAVAKAPSVEKAFESALWQRFLSWVSSNRSAGHLGGRSFVRAPLRRPQPAQRRIDMIVGP